MDAGRGARRTRVVAMLSFGVVGLLLVVGTVLLPATTADAHGNRDQGKRDRHGHPSKPHHCKQHKHDHHGHGYGHEHCTCKPPAPTTTTTVAPTTTSTVAPTTTTRPPATTVPTVTPTTVRAYVAPPTSVAHMPATAAPTTVAVAAAAPPSSTSTTVSTTTTIPDTTTRPAVIVAAAQPVAFKGTDSIALPLAGFAFVGTAVLLLIGRLRLRGA